MRTVVFTQDYANRKAGDEFSCDSTLASSLVRNHKVAKFKSEVKKTSAKKATKKNDK